MLKREKPKKINTILELFLQQNGLKAKFVEAQVITNWEQFVGKPISNRTDRLYIHNKVLCVSTQSSAVKSQLSMMKLAVLEMIAQKYGKGVVVDLRIY